MKVFANLKLKYLSQLPHSLPENDPSVTVNQKDDMCSFKFSLHHLCLFTETDRICCCGNRFRNLCIRRIKYVSPFALLMIMYQRLVPYRLLL